MKTYQLKGSSRTIAERSCDQKRALKAMRKENKIPCVLYGGEKICHFEVTNVAVRNLIYTPEIFAVELTIDGKKHMAVIKELQFQPVKDTVLHIDFLEVNEKTPIIFEVPVQLVGHAAGVKAGGKLILQLRKLKVKGIYTNIPEKLTIDVSPMTLGKTLQVGELSFDGVDLVTTKDAVVCAVKVTRAVVEDTVVAPVEASAEAEAPAEA